MGDRLSDGVVHLAGLVVAANVLEFLRQPGIAKLRHELAELFKHQPGVARSLALVVLLHGIASGAHEDLNVFVDDAAALRLDSAANLLVGLDNDVNGQPDRVLVFWLDVNERLVVLDLGARKQADRGVTVFDVERRRNPCVDDGKLSGECVVCLLFQQLVAHAVTQRLQNLDANGCGDSAVWQFKPVDGDSVLLQSAEDDFGCQRENSPRLKQ